MFFTYIWNSESLRELYGPSLIIFKLIPWSTVAKRWYLAKAYNHSCLAVPFQIPQNSFGIWPFGIWYRRLCRNCSLDKYISPREELSLFQMPLFYLWKRKETSFLGFLLLSCRQELAFSAVNPVRGLSCRPHLWTFPILRKEKLAA